MEFAVAVGSNLGDRAATIAAAAAELSAGGRARVVRRSRLHATDPVGGPAGQGSFLNGAWIVETALGPGALLAELLAVERRLGRERRERWGPRTIDLDLLLAREPRIVDRPGLTLPHPRLHERAFVLAPLVEVAADWRHPRLRRSVEELWRELADAERSPTPGR